MVLVLNSIVKLGLISLYFHSGQAVRTVRTMTNIGWGSLANLEGYGTLGDNTNDYKCITAEEIKTEPYINYRGASHGMIFARKSSKLWDLYDTKALVMMQLRFDGVFGFPGGLVDEGESAVEGMNREMHEEIGLDLSKYSFTNDHHIAAFVHEMKKLILHFYIMEVTEDDFKAMEQKVLSAEEYGIETFGLVRVPLFTMGDGIRGFPAFLANNFAGNARSELVQGLLAAQVFSKEEMNIVLKSCEEFVQQTK